MVQNLWKIKTQTKSGGSNKAKPQEPLVKGLKSLWVVTIKGSQRGKKIFINFKKTIMNLDKNFSETIIRLNQKIDKLRKSIHDREQKIIAQEETIDAMDKQLKDLELQIMDKNFGTWKNID